MWKSDMKKAKKKALFFLIPLFVLQYALLSVSTGSFYGFVFLQVLDLFETENSSGTTVTEIHEDCYIENLDNKMQSIYYYAGGDKNNKIYIVEEWEDVKKYATDGGETVAFHCVYDNLSDEEDKFVIFNTKDETEVTFRTQKEFADFCREKDITFSEWKRGDEKPFEITDFGNGWKLYDFDDNFTTDQILKGYEVVYEGHISDVTKEKDGKVSFRLIVPYYNDFEFQTSNEGIVMAEKPYTIKGDFFTTIEVCYDGILTLDTEKGELI